jgi:hypothetical protein
MKRWLMLVGALALTAIPPAFASGEIFGTIHTRTGDTYTGPIRWDRNENFWSDELNGTKLEKIEKKEDGYKFSLFGIKFGGGDQYIRHSFSIPFGHLVSIEPLSGNEADLTLKSGETIRVSGDGSSDIGRGIRSLIIDDAERGAVDLAWSSIDRVEFRSRDGKGRDAERLFGTVETTDGSFTGYLTWDRDEAMLEDIIDGEDRDGRDREIPLGQIRVIEPRSAGGSTLTLRDDSTLVLTGTNDIDDGHRGIIVQVAGVGEVSIEWDDVRRVEFDEAPPSPAYSAFDGGRRLDGTVKTNSGKSYMGTIVWDRDESHDWESLDGEHGRIDYSIPFANVRSVERDGSRGARVTLRSGETLELRGSNDVDDGHKGIVVEKAGGERIELEWMDVERVDFD